MQIKVINVALSQSAGNKYQIAEVVYKDDRDETKTKKLMSFANPATYATFKDAKNGESYEITQVKNDKGFWDWTSATKTDGTTVGTGTAAKGFTPTKSSYETTEERARRQVLIVKQSSLAQAVNFLARDGMPVDAEKAIELAQQFTDWVVSEPQVEVTA